MSHSYVRVTRLCLVAALPAVGLLGCNWNPLDRGFSQLMYSRNLDQDENRVMTVSKYLRIEPGMTYDQVIAILDVPPAYRPPNIDQVARNADVTLTWFTASGAKLRLHLRGKVVTDKWAVGLQE
jgi:hypothetical protein